MKISVVIVNYNVRYFLEQTLDSVNRALDYMKEKRPEWEGEVFVVDNNSVDGSCEMVRSRFPSVNLLANEENVGFSRANNQAIEQSSGEYILLLNPDTVIEEGTFVKTLNFMDQHPDAGGLGVKMVDGRGDFLPESKRGFPSPGVAFSKIFGLNKLFPQSSTFNYYHLGHLDKEETHKVDVLSGAFMLLRKEALDKSGWLDETYFMYGEDIDLSWRLKQAGYENYYYPEVKIIHYKGESTKKSSVNYVFTFYRAMEIFAKTHLSRQQARLFSFLIYIAIYIKAGMSLFQRVAYQMALPILDAGILFGALYALKVYWENTIKYVPGGDTYPPELLYFNFPVYILLWIVGILIYRGYSPPYSIWRLGKGVFWGTVMIAVFYAFIPEEYRFSRALIVLGAGAAAIVFSANRVIGHFIREGNLDLLKEAKRKLVLVGEPDEVRRALYFLKETDIPFTYLGYVTPEKSEKSSYEGDENFLGTLNQMEEIARLFNAEEIVFCNKNIPASAIIEQMTQLPEGINYKIIPADGGFAIGSPNKDDVGDLYTVGIDFKINNPENRFKKRALDIAVSLLLLLLSPFFIWRLHNKLRFYKNAFLVLQGRYSWVGPGHMGERRAEMLPAGLKTGILTPYESPNGNALDDRTRKRLSFLYARDYDPLKDLSILFKNLTQLDRSLSS